jgi:hypothetical protein
MPAQKIAPDLPDLYNWFHFKRETSLLIVVNILPVLAYAALCIRQPGAELLFPHVG